MENLADIFFLAILGITITLGFYNGLIKTLGGVLGLILGVVAGGYGIYYLQPHVGALTDPVIAIIVFLFIAIFVSRLAGWLVDVLHSIWKAISFLPFIGSLNRLFGGAIGFVEGIVILGITRYLAYNFLQESTILTEIEASKYFGWIGFANDIINWALPTIISVAV